MLVIILFMFSFICVTTIYSEFEQYNCLESSDIKHIHSVGQETPKG